MALELHEGTVCDAVVRYLEQREGQHRQDAWRPEEKKDGDVEYAWKLGETQYAIEHTGVEPFEGLIRMNAESEGHFSPIKEACESLSGDVLELEIPARCMHGLDKNELRRVQTCLIDWIKATAPNLPLRRYSDYIGAEKAVSVEGIPFPLRLFRFENLAGPPRLQIKHIAPDLTKERPARMERACAKKFPKLANWKKNGAKTILVLEDSDIQLTNPATVAEAFVPIARARDDTPDETYMVSSCMEPWQLWPILVDGRSYFDLAKWNLAKSWPVDASSLEWITSKRRGSGS